MQSLANKTSVRSAPVRVQRSRTTVAPRAMLSTQIAISGGTAAALILGRFVFHGWVKSEGDRVTAVSGPKTTGTTFFDVLQKPASFVGTTGDPEAFTIVELLGWGALGHVAGYTALALSSLQNPV